MSCSRYGRLVRPERSAAWAVESQVWLGRAMQALQQVSVLTGPAVDGDQVRLTLEAVTTEELAHVWALFPNTNYRTSVVYVASPVRIDK
jgi:hypothetical protein